MRNIIGCRIKVIKTGLFCEIAIGWDKGNVPFVWSRIENKMARLNIVKNGQWGLVPPGKYKEPEITIMEQSPVRKNPDGSQVFNQIASLWDVPEDFINTVGCGNYLSGKGFWNLTQEALTWETFFPCV